MGTAAAGGLRSVGRARSSLNGLIRGVLIRLGFPALNRLPPDPVTLYHDHASRVFDIPAVRKILERDLGRLDAEREAILARLCRIELYGEEGESVRAVALLVKVCGWESRTDPAPIASVLAASLPGSAHPELRPRANS